MTLPRTNTTNGSTSRWDERWKLASLFVLGLAMSFANTPWAVFASLAITALYLSLSQLPFRSFLMTLSLIAIGILPLAMAIPFLTTNGWIDAPMLMGRAVSVGLIGHIAFATSPPHRTFAALHSLLVPCLFVQLLQFTYRYTLLFVGEIRRMRLAMTLRGFHPYVGYQTVRTTSHLIGSLLVRSHDRSEVVSQAMRCRGFDGTYRTLNSFHTTSRDVVACLFTMLLAAAIVAANAIRFGE